MISCPRSQPSTGQNFANLMLNRSSNPLDLEGRYDDSSSSHIICSGEAAMETGHVVLAYNGAKSSGGNAIKRNASGLYNNSA